MQTSTRQEPAPQTGCEITPSPAEVLTAFLDKSPIVQAVIRDLVNVLNNPTVPPQERKWAETALRDALFRPRSPRRSETRNGASATEKSEVPGVREAHERMDEQERVFAENLVRILAKSNVTQAELARRVGVQPSAISMMLSRRCRPQQRTVEKIAQALGVELAELWPG